MQVFDINLKPSQSRAVDIQASYVYFLEGSAGGADNTISVTPTSGGETVYLKPGQAYKLAGAAPRMGQWIIANLKGEGTIVGKVLMGEGEFSDNRVSGSVEVVDGGKARTMAGTAFSAAIQCFASAGNFSTCQLFNPANSGVRVICSKVIITAEADSTVKIGFNNLANGALVGPMTSKLSGGTSSKCMQTNNGLPAAPSGFQYLGLLKVKAGIAFVYQLEEPLVILPGWGLSVQDGAVNTSTIQTIFEVTEEAL